MRSFVLVVFPLAVVRLKPLAKALSRHDSVVVVCVGHVKEDNVF